MNIFVLEDDLFHQQRLKRIIENLSFEIGLSKYNLYMTSKSNELIDEIKESNNLNIYFLDIEIKDTNTKGLEVASMIRNIDKNGLICFISSYSKYASITYSYKVSAYDYIDKSLDDDSFKKRIQDCLITGLENYQEINHDLYYFENKHTAFQVPFSDILYFETTLNSHMIRLVCKKRTSIFSGSLKEICNSNKDLFLAHKSYVVNINNISSINKKESMIYFNNGNSCLVSRRKISSLLKEIKDLNIIII